MLDRAEAGDIAGDCDVPGRIGEDHLRPLLAEQAPIAFRRQGVAAQEAVIVEEPEVAELGDRRGDPLERLQIVLFVARRPREGDIDLPHLKATELEVDVNVDLKNVGELERQRVEIPTRLFTEPVKREPQQPELRFVEIVYGDRGHLQQPHLPCGQNEAPACDHAAFRIDDDWENEAELLNA